MLRYLHGRSGSSAPQRFVAGQLRVLQGNAQGAPTYGRSFFWKKSGGGEEGAAGSGGDGGGDDSGNGGGSDLVQVVSGDASSSNALSKIGIGENAPKPPHLLAVPIQRRPLFPGFMAPLVITDEALMEAMIALKKTPAPFVGVFLLNDANVDLTVDKFQLTRLDQIHRVGTLAHIQQLEAGPGGAIAMLMAHRRVLIKDVANIKTPPLIVRVNHLSQAPLEDANSDDVKATSNEILATLRDIIKTNPLFQQHVSYFARRIDVSNPYSLADFAASLTTADGKELQEVLETMDLNTRLRKALLLLKKEQQLSALQQTIKQDVEKRIDKQQRTWFLMEQLKSIKKELGLEKDDKDALVTKFQERVAGLKMPPSAKTVFDEELEKLQVLERNSSEFNVTRSYLDWLTSIPWGKYSQDNFDLTAARTVLDADHYGMSDVKERILEFIAVGKLKGSVQGKIICMVGPPGVGKTSIGKSIAHALDRQFYRFSVGGLSDVAEIKGHRRTYIGAMPGKLIQCMKSTGVSNPLVLIDEIDKIGVGRGHSGDPSSALLEMLDPNQNGTFMDHYMDTPVDASKVLFICTANTLDTIPGPLLDRMEVLRLSGYDAPEKMAIAKVYLDPKIRAEMGLAKDDITTPKSLQLTDGALEELIRWHAREAGVRNLEKLISKIYRKAAIKIVQAREKRVAELKKAGSWPPPEVTARVAEVAAQAAARAAAAKAAAAEKEAAEKEKAAAAAAAAGSKAGGSGGAGGAAAPADSGTGEKKPTASDDSEGIASVKALLGLEKAGDAAPEAPATAGADDTAEKGEGDKAEAAAAASSPAAADESELPPPPPLESLVEVEDDAWTITAANLDDYVGKAPFTTDRMYDVTPPGVIMGLAWTSMGGSALYIETASPSLTKAELRRRSKAAAAAGGAGGNGGVGGPVPKEGDVIITPRSDADQAEEGGGEDGGRSKRHKEEESRGSGPAGGGHLRLTGKMGEVMQESAQIAYTVARRFLRGIPGQEANDFLDTMPLHMHVPEGATPKDGPSAGITMTTALLSTAMGKPARPDLAMTGEVTLTGRVLPVGGIKEKIMAARRAGIRCIVLPHANKKDFDELPDHLKDGLEMHFANSYDTVYAVAFEYDEAALAAQELARAQKDHPLHSQPDEGSPGTGEGGGAAPRGVAAPIPLRPVAFARSRGAYGSGHYRSASAAETAYSAAAARRDDDVARLTGGKYFW